MINVAGLSGRTRGTGNTRVYLKSNYRQDKVLYEPGNMKNMKNMKRSSTKDFPLPEGGQHCFRKRDLLFSFCGTAVGGAPHMPARKLLVALRVM
jgi:hypothetical protein